jgi:hypothetical protein
MTMEATTDNSIWGARGKVTVALSGLKIHVTGDDIDIFVYRSISQHGK